MSRSNYYNKLFKPAISIFLLITYINLIWGCSYYKVKTTEANLSIPKEGEQGQKLIFVHQDENVWHLQNIKVDEDKQEITGVFAPVPADHQYYLTTKPERLNRYKPSKGHPEYEAHLYISQHSIGADSSVVIPLKDISKIEIYDKAMGATIATYIFTGIGIIAAALVIFIVIVLLTKDSCPFIYTYDGTSYSFTGEIYAGAIYPSLQRDDYLPLPELKPSNGEYQIKLTNELLERQYTDLTNLIVIEHPYNAAVLMDKYGKIFTVSDPVSPVTALSDQDVNYKSAVITKDNNAFLFNEEKSSDEQPFRNLVLTFPKPANTASGKLIVNAKNSFWLDYIFGKFYQYFGTYYQRFAEKQKKIPAEKNIQWSLDQGIPLSVYLKSNDGWALIDYFDVVGPLAPRDMVMNIDLSQVEGETVEIMLSCGFMFWEVDHIAMDFTKDIEFTSHTILPSAAVDENGKDVKNLLAVADKKYLIQPNVGNESVIKFKEVSSKEENVHSYFLHSQGYYEYIRDYKNKPDVPKLKSFKDKGAFTSFSKEEYFKFINKENFVQHALTENNEN